MSDTATEERSAQSYVHECGDGAYISMTLSDGPPGHVYPTTVTLPGACVLCEVEPMLMRATTAEHLAELDDEDDECPDAWTAADNSADGMWDPTPEPPPLPSRHA